MLGILSTTLVTCAIFRKSVYFWAIGQARLIYDQKKNVELYQQHNILVITGSQTKNKKVYKLTFTFSNAERLSSHPNAI